MERQSGTEEPGTEHRGKAQEKGPEVPEEYLKSQGKTNKQMNKSTKQTKDLNTTKKKPPNLLLYAFIKINK